MCQWKTLIRAVGTRVSGRRILTFDLARGFAILVMVFVHVLILYGTPALNNSAPARILVALGIPTGSAPPFMFAMGAALALSGMSTREGIRRGLRLVSLGLALNLLRGIPFALHFRHGTVPPGTVASYVPTSLAAALWTVDILPFAGLAVMLASLLAPRLPRPGHWLILSAGIALGSPFLWGLQSGWIPLDHLLDLLWGTGSHVIFPLFPWCAYVLLGRAVGSWLAAGAEQTALFRCGGWAGIGLVLVGGAMAITAPDFNLGSFSRSGPGAVVAISGAVLLWMMGCHWLVTRLPSNWASGLLRYWGQRSAPMYCTHWIILSWALLAIGYRQHGWPVITALAALALGATHLVMRVWDLRQSARVHRPAQQPG